MRKTFDVVEFIANTNKMLANGTTTPEFRKGLMFALESVLFASNRYKGFRYLTKNEVIVAQSLTKEEVLPGIRTDQPLQFENTDSTRVAYF